MATIGEQKDPWREILVMMAEDFLTAVVVIVALAAFLWVLLSYLEALSWT